MMKELHTLDHSVAITDDEEEIVRFGRHPKPTRRLSEKG